MRTLKILAAVLVALALGAAASHFWIRHAADRKWAEAQEGIRKVSAENAVVLPPMPSTQPSKEIQIHFVAAIRQAARRNALGPAPGFLLGRREINDSVVTVLDEARDSLDRLHQAARACVASPADYPPGWRGEWDPPTIRWLMDCAVLREWTLRKDGKLSDAVETLLDAVQLGRFWTVSGKGDTWFETLDGLQRPMDELVEILEQERLPAEILRQVDRELEPFEAAIPSISQTMEPGFARWAESLLDLDLEGSRSLDGAPMRWRYLLPGHLMKAEAFEIFERQIQLLKAAESRGYLELVREIDRIGARLQDSGNPLLKGNMQWNWNLHRGRARLRLIRAAARYRATGEVPKLADPFGEDLRHSRSASKAKIWSLGTDGGDDGGDPRKDIVIEVDLPKPE